MARLGDHGDGPTEGDLSIRVDAIQSIGAFDLMRLRKGPVSDRRRSPDAEPERMPRAARAWQQALPSCGALDDSLTCV